MLHLLITITLPALQKTANQMMTKKKYELHPVIFSFCLLNITYPQMVELETGMVEMSMEENTGPHSVSTEVFLKC